MDHNKKIQISLFVVLVLGINANSFGLDAQDDKDRAILNRPVYNSFLTAPGWEFIQLCGEYRLICGWERMPSEQPPSGSISKWNPGMRAPEGQWETVEKMLKQITVQYPQYEYSIDDGVINLSPTKEAAKRERYSSRLDRWLPSFHLRAITVYWAAVKVCFFGRMPFPAISSGGLVIASGLEHTPKEVNLDLRAGTLRQDLNQLVRSHGSGMWIFYPTSQKPTEFLWNLIGLGPWPPTDKITVANVIE